MTSVLSEDDKIFGMYKQYKALLNNDARRTKDEVHPRTTKVVASQLTIAHMLDHVVCLLKSKEPVKVKKVNKAPKTLLESYSENG